MKHAFQLLTDMNCDLPPQFAKSHHVQMMRMGYSVDGVEYLTEEHPENLDIKEFYQKMREGASTKTVALEPELLRETLRGFAQQGTDVLYIAFSSGLSSTFQNAERIAAEVAEEFPARKLLVVDSLCASLGQGLLVYYAAGLRDEGRSIEEVAQWVRDNRLKICHYFTVDDLHFLHRGGRVSKTTAVVGSMLGIKPVLHVDDEGHLIAIGKVRGRKQSLTALVDRMAAKIGKNENKIVFISHGDCEEDADFIAEQVRRRFGIKSFIINEIGPSIGSHSGPGTAALFFVGDDRHEK